MANKKYVKIKGTKVEPDGTGYFRGDNKRFYYGNPSKNGYVVETKESIADRARKIAAERNHSPDVLDIIDDNLDGLIPKVTLSDFILATILTLAFIAFVTVTFAIYSVFYGTLFSWPYYVRSVIQNLARGAFDLPLILIMVMLVFLLVYFAFCAHEVLSKRITRTSRYVAVGMIGASLLLILVRVLSGYIDFGGFLESILLAATLVALPSLILCFLCHLVTKEQRGDQRWFITRAAKLICPAFIGKSTGMIVFGVIVFLLAVVATMVLNMFSAWGAGAPAVVGTFYAMGIVCTAMGIIDKAK